MKEQETLQKLVNRHETRNAELLEFKARNMINGDISKSACASTLNNYLVGLLSLDAKLTFLTPGGHCTARRLAASSVCYVL